MHRLIRSGAPGGLPALYQMYVTIRLIRVISGSFGAWAGFLASRRDDC